MIRCAARAPAVRALAFAVGFGFAFRPPAAAQPVAPPIDLIDAVVDALCEAFPGESRTASMAAEGSHVVRFTPILQRFPTQQDRKRAITYCFVAQMIRPSDSVRSLCALARPGVPGLDPEERDLMERDLVERDLVERVLVWRVVVGRVLLGLAETLTPLERVRFRFTEVTQLDGMHALWATAAGAEALTATGPNGPSRSLTRPYFLTEAGAPALDLVADLVLVEAAILQELDLIGE